MDLYINNQLLDTYPNSVALTYQVNDLAEIEKRQSSYSNSFKIPKTAKNVIFFEMLGTLGDTSTEAQKKHKATIIENGIAITKEAIAEIVGSDNANYELRIYDGVISLSEKIKGLTTRHLDLSECNHIGTKEAFVSSFTDNGKYIHAVANYGRGIYDTSGGFRVDALYTPACLYLKYLWQKMFAHIGMAYTGSVFNTADFKNAVIPINKGYANAEDNPYTDFLKEWRNQNYEAVATLNWKYYTSLGADVLKVFNVNFQNSGEDNWLSQLDLGSKWLAVGNKMKYIGDTDVVTFKGGFYGRADGDNIGFSMFKNGVEIYYNNISSHNFNISVDVTNGDEISITAFANYGKPSGEQAFIDLKFSFVKVKYGNAGVDYNVLFPEIKFKDLINEVMQRYALVMRVQGNNVEFITLNEMLSDRLNALDWSDKLQNYSISYKIGDYGQTNTARYRYKEDIQPFADENINLNNKTLDADATLFTSIFQANENYEISKNPNQELGFYNILLWDSNEKKLENGTTEITYKAKETGLQIYGFKWVDDVQINVADSLNGTGAGNSIIPANVPVLDFKRFNLQEHYSEFKKMLQRSRKIEATMFLDAFDVANVDFFKLIYIQQLGRYCVLNKIKSFKKGKLTKVELIEVG